MIKLRVFISSPGDVSAERALAEQVFKRAGAEFADRVQLELILWEHEPLFASAGFQDQIERPSRCDLVVSILWSRLGTRLPKDFSTGAGPMTGTEFEIQDALEGFRRLGKPNLLIYRKSSAPNVNIASQEAEERLRQYRLLEEFCKRAFYDDQGSVIVAHHLFTEPFEFERKLTEHVRKWLERETGTANTRPSWVSGSPYRGLEVFEREHKEIYFGRAQALSELLKRISDSEARSGQARSLTRFLLVSGMSGNGKSSLIRAGLIPLLEGRAIEKVGLWRYATMKPSDRSAQNPEAGPLGPLAEALSAVLPNLNLEARDEPLLSRLMMSPGDIAIRLDGFIAAAAAEASLAPNQIRVLLFIDQFEEALLDVENRQTDKFFGALNALAHEGRVWIVATLRSDSFPRLEAHPMLASLVGTGQMYVLAPPRPDELADMIRQPALAAGLTWETQDGVSLDQSILRDASASPESLPLLEYSLDQLYERRDGDRLTFRSYAEFGGLQGGIAGTAESLLTDRSNGAHQTLAKLLRSLVSVDDSGTASRRYAPIEEFPFGSQERILLDKLMGRRLCIADKRGDEIVVCFAHEALIHSWPRVADWLKTETTLLQARELLGRDTREWLHHGKSNAWLARADKLRAMSAVQTAGLLLPAEAREFIARSTQLDRRSIRIRRLVIAGLVTLSIIASGFGFYSRREQNAAREAIAAQFSLKAWTLLADRDWVRATHYALASTVGRSGKESLDPILAEVMWQVRSLKLVNSEGRSRRNADPLEQFATQATRAIFSPDSHKLLVLPYVKAASVWDPENGQKITELKGHVDVTKFEGLGVSSARNQLINAIFSPDSPQIIGVTSDDSIVKWNASDGSQVSVLNVPTQNGISVGSAIFTQDGRRLAGLSYDGSVTEWDVNTGFRLAEFKTGNTGLRTMWSPVFSPDGNTVLAPGRGKVAVELDDVVTGTLRHSFPASDLPLVAVYSADGSKILIIFASGLVQIFDAASGSGLVELAKDQRVTEAAFSSDGNRAVTVAKNEYMADNVRVWDITSDRRLVLAREVAESRAEQYVPGVSLANQDLLRELNPLPRLLLEFREDKTPTEMAFSPDGRYLKWVAEAGKFIRIADANTGALIAEVPLAYTPSASVYSPDGKWIAVTSEDAVSVTLVQAIPSDIRRFQHDAAIRDQRLSVDGTQLLSASYDRTARVWDIDRVLELERYEHPTGVKSAEFLRGESRILTTAEDGIARIWDRKTGKVLRELKIASGVFSASLSPDSARLIVTAPSKGVDSWELDSSSDPINIEKGLSVDYAVAAPESPILLTVVANEKVARLWDLNSGRAINTIPAHDILPSPQFSQDGSRLLTASSDMYVDLWDLKTGRQIAHLHHPDFVWSAALSKDGTRIVTACGDERIRIWDSASGGEIAQWENPEQLQVYAVRFSPDGKFVYSETFRESEVWDVKSHRKIAGLPRESLDEPSGSPPGAAWSADGRRVAQASRNVSRIWDLSILSATHDELTRRACAWLPAAQREFSEDEIAADPLVKELVQQSRSPNNLLCGSGR